MCEGADPQDTILLQSNHTIYDLPPGIVVEMFSDEYCEGPRLSIYILFSCPHVACICQQIQVVIYPQATRRWCHRTVACALGSTNGNPSPSSSSVRANAVGLKPARIPNVRIADNTSTAYGSSRHSPSCPRCTAECSFESDADSTQNSQATPASLPPLSCHEPNHCYNLARLPCLNMLQMDPAICESPDIIAQNGGRKPCYKSMRTADFSCTPSWITEAGRFIAGTNPYHPENQVP